MWAININVRSAIKTSYISYWHIVSCSKHWKFMIGSKMLKIILWIIKYQKFLVSMLLTSRYQFIIQDWKYRKNIGHEFKTVHHHEHCTWNWMFPSQKNCRNIEKWKNKCTIFCLLPVAIRKIFVTLNSLHLFLRVLRTTFTYRPGHSLCHVLSV